MSGPSIAAGTAAATGALAAIEATTGLNVPLGVWGLIGCLWAFWYLPVIPLRQRLTSVAIAALFAGVTAKPLALIAISWAAGFFTWWPLAVDAKLAGVPIALITGLLCHTVIGKKLIEIASRGADGVAKS